MRGHLQKLENLLPVYLRPQAANSAGWPALRRAMTSEKMVKKKRPLLAQRPLRILLEPLSRLDLEAEHGLGLEEFLEAMLAPFAAIARLLVAAERGGEIGAGAFRCTLPLRSCEATLRACA